jgi:hypothetical protein
VKGSTVCLGRCTVKPMSLVNLLVRIIVVLVLIAVVVWLVGRL